MSKDTPSNAQTPASRQVRLSCRYMRTLFIVSLSSVILLSACGGGGSSNPPQNGSLAGNWQFSLTNPDTSGNYTGTYGLQGGFLLVNGGNVTGQVVYSLSGISQANGSWAICDSGSAPVTGTISGQTVNLTAAAASQIFSLQGTLGTNGVINGTFTTPGGAATGFTSCGSATPQAGGVSFTSTSVPSLTGPISGNLHSAQSTLVAGQNFLVTGNLIQGKNIGASSASVTGTLNFLDPVTLLSDYPCVPSGILSVNGQISGNTVILQLIGTDGANAGQIGTAPSQINQQGDGTSAVTLNSTTNGYALQSSGLGYFVHTKICSIGTNDNSDKGYVCLGLNNATTCQQPITISPASLLFPIQALGSTAPSQQIITLTNTQPDPAITGLTLSFSSVNGPNSDRSDTDFTELPNFSASDTCAPGGETLLPNGQPGADFTLTPGQSCTITVSFAPQAECTWLPNSGGTLPAQCPLFLSATLTANNVPSVDPGTTFVIPIVGSGQSFLQPSTALIAFGAEGPGQTSLPQALSFTNTSTTPVQILPAASCPVPYLAPFVPLTHPLIYPPGPPTEQFPVVAAGLQVVSSTLQNTNLSTISYTCDLDSRTGLSNFRISSDTCSGALLAPQASCGLEVTFVPQDTTGQVGGLDYFLELNTVQCTDPVNDPPSLSNPCELDGGRFPVEIVSNVPSPLRMTPGASVNFGLVQIGEPTLPQTVTITNDPSANVTVPFSGRIQVSGAYSETDDCPFSLSPGGSCTLSVIFTPSVLGINPGSLKINYTLNGTLQTQIVYLLGTGQLGPTQ